MWSKSLMWLGKVRQWQCLSLGLCLGFGVSWLLLAGACDVRRPPQEVASCLQPPCDGGTTTDSIPTHDRPAPEGVMQECVVYPNGVPFIGIDLQPHQCNEPNWQAGACVDGATQTKALQTGLHLCLPNAIGYADNPPTSGTHRGEWGRWGEYSYMPPQRWLHNLEHGGIAFLYHPCASKDTIVQLRSLAKEWPEDPQNGPFRWVMTPYPGLTSAVAIVAWGAIYTANCVKAEQIKAFVQQFYLKAPENVASDGGYAEFWISR